MLHRDIKSENVLLADASGSGAAWRLGDFGVARVLDSGTNLAQTFVGTPVYMSPELFRGVWCVASPAAGRRHWFF